MKIKLIKGRDVVMKFLLAVDYISLESKLTIGLVLFHFKKLIAIKSGNMNQSELRKQC